MKKIIVVILFSFFSFELDAQTYPIPGATQQPAWVFPIFIEDAIGQKDTIYYGYDRRAMPFAGQQDFDFGEHYFLMDAVVLQAFAFQPFADSISKVEIIGDSELFSGYFFHFGMFHVYLPVTLKWDVNLFYSDSLPFIDQTPLPRGQGDIGWYYSPNSITNCFSNKIILISDTIASTTGPCVYQDSLIIFHEFGFTGPVESALDIALSPWTGRSHGVGIQELQKHSSLSLFPNPSSNILNISSEKYFSEIKISKILGNKLYQNNFSIPKQKFSLSSNFLPNGIYFLQVKFDNETVSKKFTVLK